MPASHRIALTPAEFALLAVQPGVHLPPGFPRTASGSAATETAHVGLRRRGLVDGGGTPVPAVVTALAVLARAEAGVRSEGSLDGREWTAWHAISGGLGAAVVRTEDDEWELSLFPAWELTAELERGVPDLDRAPAARRAGSGSAPIGEAPAAVAVREQAGGGAEGARGTLRFVVVAGEGAGVPLGEVVWRAAASSWSGARPGGGAAEAVRPADLGLWLAPMLATALAANR